MPESMASAAGLVFDAIELERQFQDRKYGPVSVVTGSTVQGPGGHELGAWLLIIEKELEEAKDAVTHGGLKKPVGRDAIRHELVQIAAVCVAALEQHGLEEL